MDSGSETPSEVSEKSSQLSGSSEKSSLLSDYSSESSSPFPSTMMILTELIKSVEEVEGDGKV